MTIASTDSVMYSNASGDSSVLFLMKECRGLKRFSCLLTVLFCTKSLSFLMILLTKDFTGSRKPWQVTATFCKLLFKSYLMACYKLLLKLAFTFLENSKPSLVFSTIFCATISPTFCCCSTNLLKAAGENSAFAILSRYLLTNLNASLRKSGSVPGSMQACLNMISIHFSRSGSLLDRSRIFFYRTMTHILRFQPWLSFS